MTLFIFIQFLFNFSFVWNLYEFILYLLQGLAKCSCQGPNSEYLSFVYFVTATQFCLAVQRQLSPIQTQMVVRQNVVYENRPSVCIWLQTVLCWSLIFPSTSALMLCSYPCTPHTHFALLYFLVGSPRWCSGKESACQCRRQRLGFNPWVGRISWRRKWKPTAIFLPELFHGRGA